MNVRDYGTEPMATADRVYWVTVIRPQLIASGNLIETPEMKEEAARIRRQVERSGNPPVPPVAPNVVPISAAVRTPSGDWVPPKPVSPPVRDFKAAASGERDDEPEDVPF